MEIVRLNVGGYKCHTTKATLLGKGSSYFSDIMSGELTLPKDSEGYIFIDRDPDCFRVILEFLRTGALFIPTTITQEQLEREASFYHVPFEASEAFPKLKTEPPQKPRPLSPDKVSHKSTASKPTPPLQRTVKQGKRKPVSPVTVDLLTRVLRTLGGKATAHQITQWLCTHRVNLVQGLDPSFLKKSVCSTMNAKVNANLFPKETIKKEDGRTSALYVTAALASDYTTAMCELCDSGDNSAEMLLCDGCDGGYHTYCMFPPLDKVPEGAWYCDTCAGKPNSAVLLVGQSDGEDTEREAEPERKQKNKRVNVSPSPTQVPTKKPNVQP